MAYYDELTDEEKAALTLDGPVRHCRLCGKEYTEYTDHDICSPNCKGLKDDEEVHNNIPR